MKCRAPLSTRSTWRSCACSSTAASSTCARSTHVKRSGTIRFPIYEGGDRGTMQYGFDTYRDGEESLRLSGPSITYAAPNHSDPAYGCVGDVDVTYEGTVVHIVPRAHQAVVAQTLYRSLEECNRANIASPLLAAC